MHTYIYINIYIYTYIFKYIYIYFFDIKLLHIILCNVLCILCNQDKSEPLHGIGMIGYSSLISHFYI